MSKNSRKRSVRSRPRHVEKHGARNRDVRSNPIDSALALRPVLEGKTDAITAAEQKGLELFLAKGCVSCHGGANLGGTGYFPFGVVEKPGADILPAADKGRFEVTRTASDEYVFKSPSLRNIELTAPYFHSGKVWDLFRLSRSWVRPSSARH